MSNKNEYKFEKEFDDSFDKVWFTMVAAVGIFIGGYLTGRLTAIKDLQNGLLNEFIPKSK